MSKKDKEYDKQENRKRWCGYCGCYIFSDWSAFSQHLNQCEVDHCDMFYGELL